MKKRKFISLTKGFTLMEVMVVVLIIAVLATISTVSYKQIRTKSRDIKRISTINSLQTALDAYYKDYGIYPTMITAGMALKNADGSVTYIDEVPSNPQPRTDNGCPDSDFIYRVGTNNKSYSLAGCIGDEKNAGKPKLIYGTREAIFHCGDMITDRDGFTYKTVSIGTQCWMAENLKTKTLPNGDCINHPDDAFPPDCTFLWSGTRYSSVSIIDARECASLTGTPNAPEADCEAGRTLYRPFEALQCNWTTSCGSSGCVNPAGKMCCNGQFVSNTNVKGICPDGWHIPSEAEFSTLERYLANPGAPCNPNRVNVYECAGAEVKLKAPNVFNASLVGRRQGTSDSPSSSLHLMPYPFPTNTRYMNTGVGDWFITSNVDCDGNTSYLRIIDGSVGVNRKSLNITLGRAFSVRCVKD